jgi:hypothetical protein
MYSQHVVVHLYGSVAVIGVAVLVSLVPLQLSSHICGTQLLQRTPLPTDALHIHSASVISVAMFRVVRFLLLPCLLLCCAPYCFCFCPPVRPGKPVTPALLQLSAPHLPMLLKAGLSRQTAALSGQPLPHTSPYQEASAYFFCFVLLCAVHLIASAHTDRPGMPVTPALLQLSAPHLPMLLKAGLSRRAHATHASFSSRGDKLVASYHGDHAYVFDITGMSLTYILTRFLRYFVRCGVAEGMSFAKHVQRELMSRDRQHYNGLVQSCV